MNLMRARLTPIAAALASGLFSLHAAPAAAATILVDGTTCKLQNAVQAANTDTAVGGCTAGSGADTLVLPANSTQNLEAALNGDKYSGFIASSIITIQGNGSTIRRPPTEPKFALVAVRSAATLTIQNSTLTGGDTLYGGGGIFVGQGGTLFLTGCVVTGNRTNINIGFQTHGGGIFNDDGTITLTNSTVSGNTSVGQARSRRGDIYTYARGGGIANAGFDASATLIDSTVSGNYTSGYGGGVHSNSNTNHPLTLIRSTISGNRARTAGGGITLRKTTLTMRNSTVSGNTAYSGGGLYASVGGTTCRIYDSTITGNSATSGGGIFTYSNIFVIRRSLVSGNLTAPGSSSDGNEVKTIGFNSFSLIHNLFGHSGETRDEAFGLNENFNPLATDIDATSGPHTTGIALPTPLTSILNTTLADNGGPTLTHALVPGSPAIDKPGNTGCSGTDQRGVNRPKGAACDVGAYEFGTNSADLAIAKTASAPAVIVGDPIVYTLTVTNLGPDTATAVQLVDPLPAGISYVSAGPVAPATGACVYDAGFNTVTCQLGNLALNQSMAVSIATTADSPGSVTNTGSVISSVIDSDPDTSNNASSVPVQINAIDTVPDAFGFNPINNVAPGSLQTSNTITPSGYNRPTSIAVSPGSSYAIGCASAGFTGSAGTINPGESVCVRHTASSSFSTPVTTTLTIGGIPGSFTSTTLPAPTTGDTTPDRFKITAAAEVEPNSVNTTSVRITGINVPTPVSVSGGGGMYSIAGGGFTSAPGLVTNGQTITLQLVAPPNYNARSAMTLTVGTYSDDYKLTTKKLPK